MKRLNATSFFDLSLFQHASIFDNCTYVWEAIAKINSYLKSQKLGKIEAEVPSGVFLVEPALISIGKGTVIEPGAYVRGPCVIGENCTIRHGAYIRGDFLAGDQCVIGHDTEVKNSIMLNGANAAHFAYIGDTILGNQVNLGAGTKCANLKLDHGVVSVHFDGQKIVTGLRKFGAVIGDGSQLGCNDVTNPGTLIGKNVVCYPCLSLQGFIPDQCEVKSDSKLIVRAR